MTVPLPPLEEYKRRRGEGLLAEDSGQAAAAHALQRLYDELVPASRKPALPFAKKSNPKGVYLWGGVGRGKSMLMDMFADGLPPAVKRRRVHFHEFMISVHDYLHKWRKTSEKDAGAGLIKFAKQMAADVRVLCFDEFHVTDIADAMILGRLFTALFSEGVVVVATSNWPPEKLYEGGLQRDLFLPFIKLVKDRLESVELNGPVDYRLRCLSQSGVYFHPLGSAATQKMESVFAALTGHAAIHQETLTVKGRTLHVPAAKGVARLSFSALCENPLGAEDYLAIAHAYHTVFLEGVPRLGYDRRNEAKRLMVLVDTLYDNRIKLVVTADAPPEKLYRGTDHAFEFQRTVSRLIEMQGEAYIAANGKK